LEQIWVSLNFNLKLNMSLNSNNVWNNLEKFEFKLNIEFEFQLELEFKFRKDLE
jgi:hypothetical protein